jgi:hypothetical protein
MAVVTELVDRLKVIKLLDAAIGPIKERDRGHTGGDLLVGLAAAQLAGEEFLVGLDRQRGDVAGQVLAPVPGLAATTAAGLARRFTEAQWARPWRLGSATSARRCWRRCRRSGPARLSASVTIDLDTTDVEVYGRHKRGVAYNHQGQRCGRPHVASCWRAGQGGGRHRAAPPTPAQTIELTAALDARCPSGPPRRWRWPRTPAGPRTNARCNAASPGWG